MQFYKPQLLLIKNADGDYILHTTTYYDRINVQAAGHQIDKKLNRNRVLEVELYVEEAAFLSNKAKGLNPITHLINLGNIFGDLVDGKLNGSVYAKVYMLENTTSRDTEKPKRLEGEDIMGTVSIEEILKPKKHHQSI